MAATLTALAGALSTPPSTAIEVGATERGRVGRWRRYRGRMKRLAALALAVVACGHPSSQSSRPAVVQGKVEPVLQGHLLAADGTPLPLAHVTVLGADGKPGEARQAGTDGSFRIPWATFTQPLTRVQLTGAAHHKEMLVVAREDGPFDVSVKLGAPAPRGEAKPTLLLYTSAEPEEKAMSRQPDGSYIAELAVPDGRYSYLVAGVANDPPSAEPVDGYERTKEGEYRPQIVVKGGMARIHYDPSRLHPSASSIDFGGRAPVSAGVTDVALRLSEREKKQDALLQELLHAKGGPPGDVGERLTESNRVATAASRLDLAARARSGAPPIVKQAAAVAYFVGAKIDAPSDEERARANEIVASVGPDSALWSVFRSFDDVLAVADATSASRAYADAFLATQPDPGAVSRYLLGQIVATKDAARRRTLVAELQKPRFAGTREQERSKAYDPDRPLAPGKAIAFDAKTLTGAKLGPKDLAGKVFLVDVWGTWCAPCVAEMPRLHELHAKYGGAPTAGRKKRFEIVSIALENRPELVTKFRADKQHPMPWMHGIADPDAFLESFGGPNGVPLYVLVDEKGEILASSPELSIRKLPEMLDRVLR